MDELLAAIAAKRKRLDKLRPCRGKRLPIWSTTTTSS